MQIAEIILRVIDIYMKVAQIPSYIICTILINLAFPISIFRALDKRADLVMIGDNFL